jgi:penicillin-binding protein 1C
MKKKSPKKSVKDILKKGKKLFFLPQAIKKFKLSGINFKRTLKKKKVRKIIKWSLLGLLILFVGMIAVFSIDLPTPAKIKAWQPDLSTQILDRNGKLLYNIHGDQNRQWVESNNIPDVVKQATIAAEDKQFYGGFGVNLKGLARAAYYDLRGGGYYQGGSGITQQFVKNSLLTSQRTLPRKIKEGILAIEVDILYSKDQILTMYLNTIPYGSGTYGIESASQLYFGKPAKQLNLAQAATLVVLPEAPSYYSPYGSNVSNLMARKNWVLDQMVVTKAITRDQADKAKQEKITFEPYHDSILAPHFVMWVKQILADKYGEKMVETGGLKVTTSIDLDMQQAAEQAVKDGAANNAAQFGGNDASLVSIDPKTGEILAMVGSADYFNNDIQGQVNVALSPRQPGSSFKPVAYATLFKGAWSPGSTIFDERTDFGGGYSPQNYSEQSNGPITLRAALGNSLNVPAVKVLALAGTDNVISTAKDLGITTLTDPARYGLSLVLGGAEVKLLELTDAYTAFAQSGKYASYLPILKVVDNNGKTLEENKPNVKQKLAPEIAYEIWDMLSDPGARTITFGNISTMSLPDRKTGIKTGTTSDWKDAWTVGFTTNLVTGIWAGNADNTPMNGASSAIAATPIWWNYMMAVKDKFPIEDYPKPEGIQTASIGWISNQKPTDSSPKVITDIFAPWQLPKEFDNVFIKDKVANINGNWCLANDSTPANLIQEKTYANIHSEMPDNPNWEGPVRGWAEANGFGDLPPSNACDVSNANKPQIQFNSPNNGATVSGDINVKATINTTYGLKSANFYLDGTLVKSFGSSPPFSFTLSTAAHANGSHKIRVVAIDKINLSNEASISVNFNNATPNVMNLNASPSGGNNINLTWANPANISFTRVYRSVLEGDIGNLIKDNLNTASYTDPDPGHNTYFYTVATVNDMNQESSGSVVKITI